MKKMKNKVKRMKNKLEYVFCSPLYFFTYIFLPSLLHVALVTTGSIERVSIKDDTLSLEIVFQLKLFHF